MWRYDWQVTVFLVQLSSEETNLKLESSCWVQLAHFLWGKLAHCANQARGQQCSILYASYCFRSLNLVLGTSVMPRSQKRKAERANIAPDTILRAFRAVRIEKRSIRSTARDFGILFRSVTRCCSRASKDDIAGLSQSPMFTVGYKKTHQVISGVFLRQGVSHQGNKAEVCRNFIFEKLVVT